MEQMQAARKELSDNEAKMYANIYIYIYIYIINMYICLSIICSEKNNKEKTLHPALVTNLKNKIEERKKEIAELEFRMKSVKEQIDNL